MGGEIRRLRRAAESQAQLEALAREKDDRNAKSRANSDSAQWVRKIQERISFLEKHGDPMNLDEIRKVKMVNDFQVNMDILGFTENYFDAYASELRIILGSPFRVTAFRPGMDSARTTNCLYVTW